MNDAMQAILRLRRLKAYEHWRTVYEVGLHESAWENYVRHRAKDLETVADFALSVVPKGDRPEPICSYDATTGTMLWNFDEDGEIYYGVVIEHNGKGTGGIHWDGSVGYGDEGYESESAARLALQWQRFDELVKASIGSVTPAAS